MEKKFTEFYPYGVQYYRAPTPLPEEWEADLAEIARVGYTHIQLRPQWRWHERIRGEYYWEDLDILFDLAKKYNLRVILKPMMETAPDWVFTELGGTRLGFYGNRLDPVAHAAYYVGGWWPCFDNPEVAKAVAEFVTALVKRYKDHEALWVYNAWNEPRSRPLGQCTCKHSVKSYQEFLKREFGTIENLNKTLGKAWTSFDTVSSPNSPSDYIEMFLWRKWAAESVANQVRIVADAIRRADPNAKVMCHAGACSLVQDPAGDTNNDLLTAKNVDWYGTSLGINLNPRTPMSFNESLYILSWLKRVDSNFWCQEFYAQFGPWERRADVPFIEEAILMILAIGSRGFTFWQYRSERFGEETDGFGMRNVDGSPTKRSERCDNITKLLAKLGSDFPKSAPERSPVAIYFDTNNDLLMCIENMPRGLPDMTHVNGSSNHNYKRAVRGAHTLLRRMGYTADYVTPEDDLNNYKLVIVSCVELLEEETAKKFKKYVENGGTLYIEYPFACRDPKTTWLTLSRPAYDLQELTGCVETERVQFSEDAGNKIFIGDTEEIVDGWHVSLDVVADDAEILGRWEDNSPALVKRHYGKGTVITCAGNITMTETSAKPIDIPFVYKELFKEAGLTINKSKVWELSRFSDEYEYKFLFNTSLDTETVELSQEPFYITEESSFDGKTLTLPRFGAAILKIKK